MRRRGKKDLSQKLNNILFFLAGMLAVVVIGITVIGVQTKANSSRVAYMNVGNSNPNLEQVGNDTAMFEEEDNIRTQDTEEDSIIGFLLRAENHITVGAMALQCA